jgi:transposase-like protein
MKKPILLLLAVSMASLLSACATKSSMDEMKVKCPACGHEFNYSVPSELR